MSIIKVTEGVKEVKWNKRIVRRLTKRSHVPPSPAELNEYDPLLSPESYNNYGNPTPYGKPEGGSAEGSDAGAASGAEGGSSASV